MISTAAPVVVTPAAIRVRARHTIAPRPVRPVAKGTTRTVRRTPTRLTGRALMMAAVARIPGYRAGDATWVMTSRYGSWGVADWNNGTVYISPSVPAKRMFDVVVHEWSHLLSVRPYASTREAKAAMNRVFGGSGLTGAERAADCMALQLGAAWTHYTDCANASWKAAARKLIAGRPI